MSEEHKNWIDDATYEQLLRKWRHAPVGEPMFQGDTGVYYSTVMNEKRTAIGPIAASDASKRIGW